ncbi:MAG: hypothetical protein FWG40_08430 [Peptococcaceae bacterium]|nr:hypothetical protein [Peptococcaceae bacterium]
MKRKVVIGILAFVLCLGMAMPLFAGSPAKDFDFALNAGGTAYDAALKTDRTYHADIFPRGGNVSKSAYLVFDIRKFIDDENGFNYLTYRVAKQDLTHMEIYYKNSVNMDDIQWNTVRLYANRYGQGTVTMHGVWYP